MDNTNPPPNEDPASKRKLAALSLLVTKWLRIMAETCKMRESESLTTERIDAYIAALADIPIDHLEAALKRCVRECSWFPAAAEIRAFARQTAGVDEDTAAIQAWNTVQAEIRRVGIYRGQQGAEARPFDAATDHAVRQVGGYTRLCNIEIGEDGKDPTPFIKRDFIAAHRHFVDSGGHAALTQGEAKTLIGDLRKRLDGAA